MAKVIRQEIKDCQDCPYVSLMSIDYKAMAYCNKACTALPANGKGSEELMVMAIPPWCPLEDAV